MPETPEHTIRVPLKMLQLTGPDGSVRPISFDWEDEEGGKIEVTIDRIISITPASELKSGTVGDRYECEIKGRREYIYYTKLAPRKWFKVIPVTEQEYKNYYRLPGEGD